MWFGGVVVMAAGVVPEGFCSAFGVVYILLLLWSCWWALRGESSIDGEFLEAARVQLSGRLEAGGLQACVREELDYCREVLYCALWGAGKR